MRFRTCCAWDSQLAAATLHAIVSKQLNSLQHLDLHMDAAAIAAFDPTILVSPMQNVVSSCCTAICHG